MFRRSKNSLRNSRRSASKLAGVLADRLNVDETAEKAVESLFGNFLQAVLVGSADDAKRVFDWLTFERRSAGSRFS